MATKIDINIETVNGIYTNLHTKQNTDANIDLARYINGELNQQNDAKMRLMEMLKLYPRWTGMYGNDDWISVG